VCERQTPFSHHLDKIPQTEFVAQVPVDTQNDDLAIKVSPIEQLVKTLQLTHRRPSVRSVPHLNRFHIIICTSAITANTLAASFDCQTATRADEYATCDSRPLSEMDVDMSARYEMLAGLVSMGTRRDMRDEQRLWLQQRVECGANQACLNASYAGRIDALKKQYEQLKRRGTF
jgi:hypothetical protein